MKCAELRSKVRTTKGLIFMELTLPVGKTLQISVQKSHLIKELGKVFKGKRSVETGIEFDEETSTLSISGEEVCEVVESNVDAGVHFDEETSILSISGEEVGEVVESNVDAGVHFDDDLDF